MADGPPLFGLRWVPDAQLRPLRYLPDAPPLIGGGDNDDDADGPPTPLALQQQVRALTKRLAEAEERVGRKGEQIRWLKEMTRLESRRSRVSRWMSGPLLRVFCAWRRAVRESRRVALVSAEAEWAAAAARERALQAECEALAAEHAVCSLSLDHHLRARFDSRCRRNLTFCFRRWAALRPMGARAGTAAALRALGFLRANVDRAAVGVAAGHSLVVNWAAARRERAGERRTIRALSKRATAVALGRCIATTISTSLISTPIYSAPYRIKNVSYVNNPQN